MLEIDAMVVLAAGGGVVAAGGAGGFDWANAVAMTTDDSSPPSKRLERMRSLRLLFKDTFEPTSNKFCSVSVAVFAVGMDAASTILRCALLVRGLLLPASVFNDSLLRLVTLVLSRVFAGATSLQVGRSRDACSRAVTATA